MNEQLNEHVAVAQELLAVRAARQRGELRARWARLRAELRLSETSGETT
jgi:hypothetical protein